MKASKTLGKPENWQDFETLCKKLWCEIWECPEIKKNGRAGQDQSGVDVYGIPKNENGYYGIQCKGKDEYTNKQLTVKEINNEIKKALKFTPKLKKFYFTTTAVKDAKIEEIIRTKNIEHKKIGLFEIHIFSWEDIVDLIFENQETYNYYVNSLNFKTNNSVNLTFHDDTKEITIISKFKRKTTHFNQKIVPAKPMLGNPMFDLVSRQQHFLSKATLISKSMSKTEINYSYVQFYLKLHNTGTTSIEEYKIILEFEGDIQDLADTNEKSTVFTVSFNHYISNTFLYPNNMTGKIIPKKNILVGDDILKSENIFLKPAPKDLKIIIRWKLLSKYFKDNGELILNIKSDIETDYKTILVEDPLKVRIVEGEIEDYIVDKEYENK
jgi:hypothetical protein